MNLSSANQTATISNFDLVLFVLYTPVESLIIIFIL